MLNARDADAAYAALPYPKVDSQQEQAVQDRLFAAYDEAKTKITGDFRDWLVNKHASTLPATVQNKIWEKAWNGGDRAEYAGYEEVEKYYVDYAVFAAFAINEAK